MGVDGRTAKHRMLGKDAREERRNMAEKNIVLKTSKMRFVEVLDCAIQMN